MLKITYYITGLAPLGGPAVNALFRAFDLGSEGLFVRRNFTCTGALAAPRPKAESDAIAENLRASLETSLGWREVTIAYKISEEVAA